MDNIGVGDVANIAQVTGLDAVKLIGLIVKAANTVHRKNCRQFANHLKLIGNLLQQLKIPGGLLAEIRSLRIRQSPEVEQLEDFKQLKISAAEICQSPEAEQLEDALRRSYLLVQSCKDRSYLYLLAMGSDMFKEEEGR